jgi:molybdopterin-guanine dinucleotide biosynthesis protein A
MTPPDAFLLAGGRSSRMGRDKALLPVDGLTFLERVARAASPVARTITVIGREGSFAGYRALPDLRPGLGPLAAIETALSSATTPAALVVACDLPLVSTALLELLLDVAAAETESIVVPEDAAGRPSPLCALYPRASRGTAARLLDEGERRPRALLAAYPTRVVRFAEYRHLPRAERLLENVNTPGDYDRVARSC